MIGNHPSKQWYVPLSIDQKIMLKELCPLLVGLSFEELGHIFSFEERIEILYNKLQKEGFLVGGSVN
jgi:hypothetical protein